MTTEFLANTVVFGDQPGLGEWEIGHFRQHLRYNGVLAARSPAVVIPVFPIMNLVGMTDQEVFFWLDAHENWHEQIRPFANVTGINLSFFDVRSPDSFYEWQDLHSAEHNLIDRAFGLA